MSKWDWKYTREQQIFKAVKMLRKQKRSNTIAHGKDGKPLLNTQGIYNEMRQHFENYFYHKSHETIETSEGEKQLLNLPISLDEIKIVIKKLNNNRASYMG